jgi:hypothetical protein
MKVTADDIARLLASPPPRQVPAQVAKAAMGGGSWSGPLIGLVFGAFGMVFVTVFFPWRFWDDWRLASGDARTARGVITEETKTNLTLNKRRVMEYGFQFSTEDNRPRRGHCFTTGRQWSVNTPVSVRYLPARPELACVEGARLSQSGWGGAFVIIFPLIGGAILIGSVTNRQMTKRLLQSGTVTEAEVVSVEPTNMQVNNRSVFKITVRSATLQGGQPVTVLRVNRPEIELARKNLQDKLPVFIVYDTRNPKRLLLPEALIDSGT